MNVHVIGGSGFVGRHIVNRLVDDGHRVTGLARSERAADRLRAAGAEAIAGDLDDASSIGPALTISEADALVTSVPFALGHGPVILAAAERAGISRGTFISTTSIHTRLPSASKHVRIAAEDRIRSSSIDWTIVRPTMIYGGPDDRNMARLLRLLRRTPIVPLPGGGRGLLQPVHVADVAQAVVATLDRPATSGQTYEIAGPDPLPLRRVVEIAAASLGRRVRIVSVPLRPVVAGTRLLERLGSERLRAEQVERLVEDKAFDIASARRDLSFAPRSFDTGIGALAAAL